jgi:DNA primase catalytic core
MKYPQSFIEEIKARIRVSEVIGKVIPIKRAGREFHALCPFHKEKTPSFTINDEKGFFHCFGCGAHGDVIGFTMDYEHLGYREAIEKLAGQAGLTVPQPTRVEMERVSREQSLQQVIEAVAGWLEDQLMETSEGEIARQYLAERGMKPETVSRFRMGYAPADRDALKVAMKQRGISEQQLIDTGMLISVDGRAPYSRFRRRLMFPIRDRKSRVIGFGGRVLPGEPNTDAPKYLNSPETALFHKGRQLFNLDIARRAAYDSRQLIICEGYMDVIALGQAGIDQAVAPLGTAITEDQLQLCWQLVDEPTLCLDGDNAGQRAMMRASELALPLLVPGKTLRMAVLPKGEDPDTMVRSIGKEAFEDVIAKAQPLSEVLWHQIMVGATTPEARAAQEQTINTRIAQIKNPTVQHYYKQYVREKLRESQQPKFTPYQKKPYVKGGQQQDSMRGAVMHAVPVPPIMRNADMTLLAPAANLIALVVAQPTLLLESSAEETWLHAPMPAAWQQLAHRRITELHIEAPESEDGEFWHTLNEELPADVLAHIHKAMEVMGVPTSVDETIRRTRVARLWGEVVNDVDRARLKVDCADAEALMAAEMNDDNFQRYMALKGQLEALERERARFYLEDPLPSAATY